MSSNTKTFTAGDLAEAKSPIAAALAAAQAKAKAEAEAAIPATQPAAALAEAGVEKPEHYLVPFFQILENMHTDAIRNVQFRLVASLNSTIIYNVLAHVRRNEGRARLMPVADRREDASGIDDPHTEDRPTDEENFEKMSRDLQGFSQMTNIEVAEILHTIREYLLAEVTATAYNEVNLSYMESMDFQLKQEPRQRATDKEIMDLVKSMEILGLGEYVQAGSIKAGQIKNAERSQTELRARRDIILSVIGRFDDGATDIDEADDAFRKLPVLKQRQMAEMLLRAITSSMSQAASRVGERGFDAVGTLLIFKDSLDDTKAWLATFKKQLHLDNQ